MCYTFYELLIYESPPKIVPKYKKYEENELHEALNDFDFIKQFNGYYNSVYLMKITIKDNNEKRERIKEYIISK